MPDYKPSAYQDISKLKSSGFMSPLLAAAQAKGLLPMSSFASTPEGAAAAAPPVNPNMGAMNPNNPIWDPFGVSSLGSSGASGPAANPVWDPFGMNSWKKSGYATGGDVETSDPMNPMGGPPASRYGLAALERGGVANNKAPVEGYLDGPGDGMSDSIKATIDGHQPARLADGEFVIPADVVSHLGNGSSKAGAKVLYAMMDNIRKARTGNPKQGKEINPKKFLPV